MHCLFLFLVSLIFFILLLSLCSICIAYTFTFSFVVSVFLHLICRMFRAQNGRVIMAGGAFQKYKQRRKKNEWTEKKSLLIATTTTATEFCTLKKLTSRCERLWFHFFYRHAMTFIYYMYIMCSVCHSSLKHTPT